MRRRTVSVTRVSGDMTNASVTYLGYELTVLIEMDGL